MKTEEKPPNTPEPGLLETTSLIFFYVMPIITTLGLSFYDTRDYLVTFFAATWTFAIIIYFANAPLFESTPNFVIGCLGLTVGVILFHKFSFGFFIASTLWISVLMVVILSSPLFASYNFFTFTGLLAVIAAISTAIALLFSNELMLTNVESTLGRHFDFSPSKCYHETKSAAEVIQRMHNFMLPDSFFIVEGPSGIGKTTALRNFALNTEGVYYHELLRSGKLENIPIKLFKGPKPQLLSYIMSYLYTYKETRFEDVEDFFEANHRHFIKKYKRPPIFIFDGIDALLEENDGKHLGKDHPFAKLIDFAKKGASTGYYTVVFITSKASVLKDMRKLHAVKYAAIIHMGGFTKNEAAEFCSCIFPKEPSNVTEYLISLFGEHIEFYVKYAKLRAIEGLSTDQAVNAVMLQGLSRDFKEVGLNFKRMWKDKAGMPIECVKQAIEVMRDIVEQGEVVLEDDDGLWKCNSLINGNIFKVKESYNETKISFNTSLHRKWFIEQTGCGLNNNTSTCNKLLEGLNKLTHN